MPSKGFSFPLASRAELVEVCVCVCVRLLGPWVDLTSPLTDRPIISADLWLTGGEVKGKG